MVVKWTQFDTAIKVRKEVRKKLNQLKLDWDCKSLSDVIERLLALEGQK